jgi:DNA-binding GntR family transcriptional regulator
MAKISTKNGKMLDQDRKAYLGICQLLFNNELNPGQKIAFKDLAQRLNVSTTPVIHALKLLELKGITRREPNKGYFINTIDVQEVEEIFDARIALETSLLPKTIKLLDRTTFKKLKDALRSHDEAVAENDFSKRVMTDLRFHMTMASLSKTRIQVNLLEDLFDRLLLKYNNDLFYASMIETSQREHYAILDAIQDKDLNRSIKALTHHLKQTQKHIIRGLTQSLQRSNRKSTRYHSFEDIKEVGIR